ncbi:MAG TPA: N-acetyltransferase [Vicinamibacterales bacterium]|jgi:ribosomal protein S18 acetylase RimI-like enzyme|nr:N-acetyltransferase [Vicinamibacterales bacterium]
MPVIRRARANDGDAIWTILKPMVRAGETYTLPRNMSRRDALEYWQRKGHDVFVAEESKRILGTYFLQANQMGGGAHVANCGYVTSPDAQGTGVGRAMLEHSLEHARARGFLAMQFNFVVSTNERAVKTWQAYGFEIVGRLPAAFEHPRLGFVDALVMYKRLTTLG